MRPSVVKEFGILNVIDGAQILPGQLRCRRDQGPLLAKLPGVRAYPAPCLTVGTKQTSCPALLASPWPGPWSWAGKQGWGPGCGWRASPPPLPPAALGKSGEERGRGGGSHIWFDEVPSREQGPRMPEERAQSCRGREAGGAGVGPRPIWEKRAKVVCTGAKQINRVVEII